MKLKLLVALICIMCCVPAWADVYNGIAVNLNTPDGSEIFSTTSVPGVAAGTEYQGYCLTGSDNGECKLWYKADDFNGTPIVWSYVSPFIPANNPAQNSSMKKFVIMTHGFYQQFNARAYTLSTYVNGFTNWVPQDGQYLFGNPTYATDISTWNFGSATTLQDQLIDFSSRGSGRFWCLRLFGGANANDHIDLMGVQALQTIGGLKQ